MCTWKDFPNINHAHHFVEVTVLLSPELSPGCLFWSLSSQISRQTWQARYSSGEIVRIPRGMVKCRFMPAGHAEWHGIPEDTSSGRCCAQFDLLKHMTPFPAVADANSALQMVGPSLITEEGNIPHSTLHLGMARFPFLTYIPDYIEYNYLYAFPSNYS